MKQTHADRDHSVWSASATAANWTCAGRLAMTTISPDDEESIYAAEGTAAHEIAERALRSDKNCAKYLGEIIKTKKFEIEITEEIVESAQKFVDYVDSLNDVVNHRCELFLEQKYSLESLEPPFDAGGTCDAIVVNPVMNILEVVDLKHGRGVVDVNENKQTRTYALLALLNINPKLASQIDYIKSTIVQPRAYHKSGIIRSETFHVADLVEWTADLMKAMGRSKVALDEFEQINGSRVKFDEWAEKNLTPGNCKFCPAEGSCPALRKKALTVAPEVAKIWFEDPSLETPPTMTNQVDILSPDELAHILDGLDVLEDWIKAIRSRAHTEAEKGIKIPGYQLVEKIGNRKWAADEEKIIFDLKEKIKLDEEQIFSKKLLSPSQIEKIIGAKRKTEIANMWMNPVTGTNLVSEQKTSRSAVKTKVESFFEPVKS